MCADPPPPTMRLSWRDASRVRITPLFRICPLAHQFTDYAAPWFPVPDDDLPKFPERLDWTQLDLNQ